VPPAAAAVMLRAATALRRRDGGRGLRCFTGFPFDGGMLTDVWGR
jgi:hypothetical protein